VGLSTNDVSESPIVNTVHQFYKRRAIPDLESHVEAQLSVRMFANFDHLECAGDVNSYRLLQINVLLGVDDGLQMLGMIIGRSRDNDRIHFLGIRNSLVRVGTYKELGSVQRCIAFCLLHLVEMLAGDVQLILEHIAQGDHASAERLPFSDASFTAVAMSVVFVLGECHRVMTARGRIAIYTTAPELRGTPAAPEPPASRGHFYADEELVALARRAGFANAAVANDGGGQLLTARA